MQKINTSAQQFLNKCLDKIVRPKVYLVGRSWYAYLLWQYIGIAISTLVVLAITILNGLSSLVMACLAAITVLISVFLYKSVEVFDWPNPLLKWLRGGIYHYQAVILVSAIMFLWLVDEPILIYLDIFVVGIAVAQINGRIGCLMAGCCHGRPHTWGVCYGKKHSDAGYLNYLQGVRLLPVQLLESIWLFFITFVAVTFILAGNLPGEILSLYVLGYGTGRFLFEFLRADTDRVYFWGFSEAQCTALLFMFFIVFLELADILVLHLWHVGATVFLFSVAVVVSFVRHFGKPEIYELLHPYHLRDFVEVVGLVFDFLNVGVASVKRNSVPLSSFEAVTFLNVRLSAIQIDNHNGGTYKYSISYQNDTMTEEIAQTLASLILQLKHPFEPYELIERARGVFHLSIQKKNFN